MKTKITKYTYSCDGGSLRLVSERGSTIMFGNKSGDGDYPLYFIEADGWGPALFEDEKEYNVYNNFEKTHKFTSASIAYLHTNEESWKVLLCDWESDFNAEGILLDKKKYYFVHIYRRGNTFYVYAYYRGTKYGAK